MKQETTLKPDPEQVWTVIGQNAQNPKDRILNSATELFCTNGFAATGIDTIVSKSGAAKSTLYTHFASKEDLIVAVLDREGQAWRAWFFGYLSQVGGTPQQRLKAVFDVLEIWFNDPKFYGCPFINAIAEVPQSNQRLRAAARRHKSEITTWLTAQAIEMRSENPSELARQMVVLIDGAIIAAQVSRDSSFAKTARSLVPTLASNPQA